MSGNWVFFVFQTISCLGDSTWRSLHLCLWELGSFLCCFLIQQCIDLDCTILANQGHTIGHITRGTTVDQEHNHWPDSRCSLYLHMQVVAVDMWIQHTHLLATLIRAMLCYDSGVKGHRITWYLVLDSNGWPLTLWCGSLSNKPL